MMMKPSLLHIGLCVGSESLPKYFDAQTNYSEFYLNGSLIDNLNNLKEVPDYIFIQIQNDKYDGNRSTLGLIPSLKRLKEKGSFIISWTGDKRHSIPSWMYPFAGAVNITCFSNEDDVNEFKKRGFNSDFLQIGIDEDIFKPDGETVNIEAEIVFQANRTTHFPLSFERDEMVRTLQKRYGNKFAVYGNGWNNQGKNTNASQHEEAKIYRSVKIAINHSQFNSERYTSDRMFRILGCGTFCLSHNYKGIEKDFTNENQLVTYSNINDLIQKIDYWLENKDTRKKIAEEGQKHCYKNFTYTQMVNKILSLK